MKRNLLCILLGVLIGAGSLAHANVTDFLVDMKDALIRVFVQIDDAQVSNGIKDTDNEWRIYKDATTGKWILQIDAIQLNPCDFADAPTGEGTMIFLSSPSISLGQYYNETMNYVDSHLPADIPEGLIAECSLTGSHAKWIAETARYR